MPRDNGCERNVALSQQETSCLRWIAKGTSSWKTGEIMDISENTVNFHIKNAMRKLGASSRTQAVVIAIRLNLL
ncbi:helix-turn-helix transcriptional regulator [Bradyrhizobium huanghuaihaiense]|uniref:response regulator transcription factor n=1 Tax=Bradyrhizobium huanghuaihaiense TaxID=990078 RepID=UPI0021AA1713|nr:helix-turn-helix transcriptional regulator [Bradyrhizobium sp. CB3035]UWU75668.1 helix-turn-helix transcriptional regulator [Bradyrhizobium sp. CB3035]